MPNEAIVTATVETVAVETVVTATVEANEAIERYNVLVAARSECAGGLRKANGLINTYAMAISAVCGEGWVYLVGADSKTVREERKMFDRAMGMVEGTQNKPLRAKCNEYWRRIRIDAGYVKTDSAGGTSTVDQKTFAELKTMLNRIFEGEVNDACPDSSDVKHFLVDAFVELGGDMSKIGTKG